ncbi:phage tail assembly chaperone [Alcaligenes faecalis]|uniref:phage tail assembly chaperone n=1 Tax=Alcaligenes faecalis TaxID=511 RepID=UPI00406A3A3F
MEDYERFGQEIPESLMPPDLHDVEWSYWQAFWELSTDRQVGMASGPVPWTAIHAYAQSERITDVSSFAGIIRAMDDAYLSHQGGESKTFTRDMLKR